MSQNMPDDSKDILSNLYNACDPKRAAEPKYYVNFSEARGGDAFVRRYCKKLENSPLQTWDNSHEDRRALLEGLVVLEYYNGGQDEENLEEDVFWYAVHPAARELRPFKDAVNAQKTAAALVEKVS